MKKQRLKKTILVGAISTLVALSSICVFAINKNPIARLLIRDVVVATVAHHKAGEEIILDSEHLTFTLDYSQIIVPFFAQESIRETPIAPTGVIVDLQESGRITGRAFPENGAILLTLPKQIDSRKLLPVLVHEQVHLQEGRFLSYNSLYPWTEFIPFEANTQAASLEVLAALCHSGDDLACAAFWGEIEEYSNSVFWLHLEQNGLERWYPIITELFWSGGTDFQLVSARLSYSYFQYPWEQIIIPGISGESLNTGNTYDYELSDGNFVCRTLLMPFDDTEQLLGWLDQFIEWITPEGD